MPITTATWYRRHPHQILIAMFLTVVGLPILIDGPREDTVLAELPLLIVYSWASVFVLGGILIITAAFIKDALHALYLELIADLPVALTAISYAIINLAISGGARGISGIFLYGGAGIAFLVRSRQCLKLMHEVRLVLRNVGERP